MFTDFEEKNAAQAFHPVSQNVVQILTFFSKKYLQSSTVDKMWDLCTLVSMQILSCGKANSFLPKLHQMTGDLAGMDLNTSSAGRAPATPNSIHCPKD